MGCATGVGRSIRLKNPQNHNSLGRDSMLRYMKSTVYAVAAAAAFAAMVAIPAIAQDKQPIKIGFGMAETGPLGPNGKSALLAMEIWVEETNAKGGLIGRPVQLVHYDDQSNPSTVPGIYSKLLDVDKVDVIVGGYGTNMLAPAMPVVVQRKKHDPLGARTEDILHQGLLRYGDGAESKATTVAIV